jgi:hypothetical protein
MRDAAPTFALAVWAGTIGGAVLAVDPDPNVTPPVAGRIVRYSAARGAVITSSNARMLYVCGVVAASSITLRPWYYSDALGRWVPHGAPVTVTPNGAALNYQVGNAINRCGGAKFFVQITANTLVQAVGYDFF